MSMTPEEIFNQQVWEILQDIKEEILVTTAGKPVKYRVPNIVGLGIIPPERRRKILYKLEEKKAFTIQRNSAGVRIGTGDIFYLIINTVKFDEVYKQYNLNELIVVTKDLTNKKEEPLDVIISDLETRYEDILDEKNDNNYYLKIADYGKYLLNHPVVNPVILPLFKQSQEDVIEYKKSCDIFIEKWKVLAKDLVEQAEKAGIVDHPTSPFINQINQIRGRMEEMPSYDEDYLSYYFRPYLELTKRFKDEGKFDLISSKHFFTNKEKGVEYLLLSNEFEKAQTEWEKFKKIRELQVWWAHYKIMRLTHGVFNLRDKDEYFHNDSLIDSIFLFDFQQIAQGKQTILLRRNVFEQWIKRLHQYLIPRFKYSNNSRRKELIVNKDDENIILEIGGVQYDKNKGKLQYKENQSIDVQPENQDVKYLALLLNANGNIVRNAEAARILSLNGYHESVTDKDMALDIQPIKKKVKSLLIKCGMSSKDIDNLIIPAKGIGYKLKV